MHKLRTAAAIAAVVVASFSVSAQDASATTPKQKALSVAKSKLGKAYKYGAAGPNSFDCSGYTQYSYKGAGKKIPRTAQQQYNASRHVKYAQVGDLVFFGKDTRHITHVGIYAGHSKIYNGNTGSYRGLKMVLAPTKEYRPRGVHEWSGQVK